MNNDPQQRPFDVFISYSSQNKLVADAVCAKLEGSGVRCWIASREILAGTEWGEAIIHGLEQSRLMVLIFSEHANSSPQIRREVERAVAKELPIIPFRIQNTRFARSLEYGLSNTHWLDAFDPPLEKHIDLLKDVVGRLLASPGAVEAYAQESRPLPRARSFGAIAWVVLALVLVLAGFGIYHLTRQNSEEQSPPSPHQAAIEAKLEKFHFDKIIYDGLPLSEIVKDLQEKSKIRDPDNQGINFSTSGDFANGYATDPATGLPVTGPDSYVITISLSNVSLADTLKAICASANQPIDYYIEDYGVVFYPIVDQTSSTNKWWLLLAGGGSAIILIYFINRKTGWLTARFRKKAA